MTMPKVTKTVVLTPAMGAKSVAQAITEIRRDYGNVVDLKFYQIDRIEEKLVDENTGEKIASDIRNADIVWFDAMHLFGNTPILLDVLSDPNNDNIVLGMGSMGMGYNSFNSISDSMNMGIDRNQSFIRRAIDHLTKKMMDEWMEGKDMEKMAVGWLKWLDMGKMGWMLKLVKRMGRFPSGYLREMVNRTTAMEYWMYGGKKNVKNLLLYLANVYGGQNLKFEPPQMLPDSGIYHPLTDEVFTNLDDYLRRYELTKAQTVGMLICGSSLGMDIDDSIAGAGELMKRLEGEANVIPIYCMDFRYWKVMRDLFYKDGKPIVDLVVNFTCGRLNGGPIGGGDPRPTLDTLQYFDVPLLNTPPLYMSNIQNWKESEAGISMVETVSSVLFPELDGCIGPFVPCGYEESDFVDVGTISEMAPIPERLDRIAGTTKSWLKLRRKENSEKRVALILYCYPPNEAGVGFAGDLNALETVKGILKRLKEEGYSTIELPEDMGVEELFTTQGISNSDKWSSRESKAKSCITVGNDTYLKYYGKFPQKAKDSVVERWGEPPGTVLTHEEEFIIPGVQLGNVFIGLQPSHGGDTKDVKETIKAYHDKTIPPHHQYFAFYRWLEEEFKADVVVHIGTHGTLEFTTGKEVGLSESCSPDILMGNLPHLYIYMVSDPTEGVLAKRRSYAALVDHLSPPYIVSELYDELAELEELIREYKEAERLDPERAKIVHEQILEKAKEAHFEEEEIDEIYDELFIIRRRITPKGLHTFGEGYDEESFINFITFVLRYDRGEIKSLHRVLAYSKGIDYDEMMHHPEMTMDGKSYAELAREIEKSAKEIVVIALNGGSRKSKISVSQKSEIFEDTKEAIDHLKVPETSLDDLKKTLAFGLEVAQNIKKSNEMGSLLHGLEGKYISPNVGGDSIRSPEVFPTGSNLYEFDPRMVPSDAAYARGVQIAEQTLDYYKRAHGRYPETMTTYLNGFETAITRGEGVGEVLRYIGVKVVRKNPWDVRLEVISLRELGRPRINVVVELCPFFRDQYPHLVKLMDDAFNLVSSLDEPLQKNLVKKSSQEIFEQLKGEIEDVKMAQRLANVRIFGPPPGWDLDGRISDLIESGAWESEEDLAQHYLSHGGYVYTADLHGYRSEDSERVYRRMLSKVEAVSFIDCFIDYDITEADDYFYNMYGALAKSVEVLSGKKPEILVSDSTEEIIRTEDVGDVIRRSVRTRLLNPKWIEGMLEEGYSGVDQIAARADYLLGLAATTNKVDNWIWDEVDDRFIRDEELRRRMEELNPWAVGNMIERLLDVAERGYWEASNERLEELRNIYLEVEGWIEEKEEKGEKRQKTLSEIKRDYVESLQKKRK